MSVFQRLVANLQKFLGINRIYQIKLMHERVQQLLHLISEAVSKRDVRNYQKMKLEEALCVAIERGHVEYVTHFLRSFSYHILDVENQKSQSPFQIASECRQYNVYNLLCEFIRKLDKDGLDKSEYGLHSDKLKKTVEHRDNLGNNMLHTVARITPLSQIDHIQGATLQMQRELQWFKEVESIAEPKDCESVNKDNMTPRKVFKENHKELGKEAEKSMKETATSCTVVGALIVTIMFAAAFTIPGENDKNDEKTNLPIFLTNKVFTTFIVSDAISLFSSTTSVIMFLGILTSRYSEDDFYKSLPTKMIIGLFTLFLSIATMMIVFSCGLYIMLDGKSSIVIPSILFASVPVASFIWMQFSLLVELFISTFGRGVFDRKQKTLF
ncbi:ankyrin repeat-containing protein [Pyrus ussuriensis x Pyrus communis]|uniref:Ankyrin repeat-containing protein n=1 Tax=Pyrus ussuriensis x Pyrus communis TaxID=2448454 RepID=A0A5N5GI89_9ROSA|nr:ankyrin repeat-containing protein [Pyrus ussuriensis x Pyrus communis]